MTTPRYIRIDDNRYIADFSPVRGANLNQILQNQRAIGTVVEFRPPWVDGLVGGAPAGSESLLRTFSVFVPDRFVGPSGTRLTIQPCYRFLCAVEANLDPLVEGTVEIRYRVGGGLLASSQGRSQAGTRGQPNTVGRIDEPVVMDFPGQVPDTWIDLEIYGLVVAGPATYCNLYMGWHEYTNAKDDIPGGATGFYYDKQVRPFDFGVTLPDALQYRTNRLEALV